MPSSMLHSTWVAQIDGWPRHIGWHRRRQTSVCAAQDCSRFIRLCDRTESDHRVDEILWLRQPDIVPMSGPPKFLWPDATEVWVARQERSDGRGLPVLPSAFFGPKCQRGEVLELYFARGSLNSPRPSLGRARSGSCHPVRCRVAQTSPDVCLRSTGLKLIESSCIEPMQSCGFASQTSCRCLAHPNSSGPK